MLPAAPGPTPAALTRRLVMRKMRVPVPGGSSGTLKKLTLLGWDGVICPMMRLGARPFLKSTPLPPTPVGAGLVGEAFNLPAPVGAPPGSSINKTASNWKGVVTPNRRLVTVTGVDGGTDSEMMMLTSGTGDPATVGNPPVPVRTISPTASARPSARICGVNEALTLN